jgi:EmrB/QacA subfamily drug resistance transporter
MTPDAAPAARRRHVPQPGDGEIGGAQHTSITFAVLVLAVSAYCLLQSLVIPVLPTIEREFHSSQSTVTWVLTAYLLSASVATPIIGRIGDKIGKERMLRLVLICLGVGAIVAALAPNIGVLLVARVIQGAGGAVFPLAFGIIRDEFPEEKVGAAIANISALLAVGSGLGIVAAGPVTEHLGVRWLFWLPLVLIVPAYLATALWVPPSQVTASGHISSLAGIELAGFLVCLLLGINQGPDWGWGSPRVLGLFILAAAFGVLWVRRELRSAVPLVDMTMMRIPTVAVTNISAFLFGFTLYGSAALIPQFLETAKSSGYGFGISVTEAGLFLVPQVITIYLAGRIAGKYDERFGAKRMLIAGSILTLIALTLLTAANSEAWEIILATAIQGAGLGLAFGAMPNLVVTAVHENQTGVATGMNANIRTVGGALGSTITASLVTAGVAVGATPKLHGWTVAFATLAAVAALTLVASVVVPAGTKEPVEN